MTMLPDFKLETYLAKWEFGSRYHMTASDMESMTVSELRQVSKSVLPQRFGPVIG
jgi:hypothetical protein